MSMDVEGLVVVTHKLEPDPKADCYGHEPTRVVTALHWVEEAGPSNVEHYIRHYIRDVRRVGAQLANVAYNFGDNGISHLNERALEVLHDLRRQWDALPPVPASSQQPPSDADVARAVAVLCARFGLGEGDRIEIRYPTLAEDRQHLRELCGLNVEVAANGAAIALRDAAGRIVGEPEDDEDDRPVNSPEIPDSSPDACGLCGRRGPLASGRTICADCAHFPLD